MPMGHLRLLTSLLPRLEVMLGGDGKDPPAGFCLRLVMLSPAWNGSGNVTSRDLAPEEGEEKAESQVDASEARYFSPARKLSQQECISSAASVIPSLLPEIKLPLQATHPTMRIESLRSSTLMMM